MPEEAAKPPEKAKAPAPAKADEKKKAVAKTAKVPMKVYTLLKYTGLVILSLWLILQGLGDILKIDFPEHRKILPILNMIGGAFLIMCLIKRQRGDIGILLLGAWSILQSSSFLFHISFSHSNTIIHILGLIAGILLILKV
ncbi:MAG: hypothetical protein KAG10_02270 [Methylococcales bacterium]|nr:hypothetical protein [Methylococcales bacterium]MCK5924698.1 hypothetical protein [Methylococcales bacterium]